MEIVDRGFVFNAGEAKEPLRVCTFTSLCMLSSGTILATFRRGSTKNSADGNCAVYESGDGGESWKAVSAGFDTRAAGIPGEIREAEIAELADGTLIAFLTWMDRSSGKEQLYDAGSDTVLPSRLLLSTSRDGGRTWGPNRVLATGAAGSPVLTGPTVRLPGKGWLVPFENYEPEERGGPSIHSAHALFSTDGRSFDTVLTVARHPQDSLFYWDHRQRLCPKTGKPVALLWTYNRAAEQDLDIHIAWGHPDTLSWGDPAPTGIRGQIAAPIPLADGRLFAFYVHRHAPGSLRLILSRDSGRSWEAENELTVYESSSGKRVPKGKGSYAEYWEEMAVWSYGHPSGIALGGDALLLIHYAGSHERCLNACWARVRV